MFLAFSILGNNSRSVKRIPDGKNRSGEEEKNENTCGDFLMVGHIFYYFKYGFLSTVPLSKILICFFEQFFQHSRLLSLKNGLGPYSNFIIFPPPKRGTKQEPSHSCPHRSISAISEQGKKRDGDVFLISSLCSIIGAVKANNQKNLPHNTHDFPGHIYYLFRGIFSQPFLNVGMCERE